MVKKKESPMLKKHLETKIHPAIQANLESLQGLGIDPELFAQFESRIKEIIQQNPASEEVVAGELGKTQIGVESLFTNYNREFRSILDHAANDDIYFEDSQAA